ncbi:MAG: glutamate--tRNA ligase, partial [Elusimicrobiota bacterium]|nr:glutamate--tRNA ligase [Elusimicrobiota bacterium]
FNYLFSKREGGKFILRIEDTDEARSTESSAQIILNALKWLGLDFDEGPGKENEKYAPYFQMLRKEAGLYQKYIRLLIEKGCAYPCYCSAEEVEEMRKQAQLNKMPPKYNGKCSNLTAEQRKEKEAQGIMPVIRFKMPKEGKTAWADIIRGNVEFENNLLDDFVIAKANGTPTYNFACVIDDFAMDITHIIRGDDHISNTPKQIQIYKALGWEIPNFAHTAMILGPDGTRLSKRHGHTSVLEYQKEGYLPEALINYLALLGWSTADSQQIFTMAELKEKFSLDMCGGSPSTFDPAKLLWLNGEKIRSKTPEEVYEIFLNYLKETAQEHLIENWDSGVLKQAVSLEREKIKTLKDIYGLVDFFFVKEVIYQEEAVSKVFLSDKNRESAKIVLGAFLEKTASLDGFGAEDLEKLCRNLAEENNLKTGQVFHPIRVAVSGRTQGPSLFHLLELLGKDESMRRIKTALEKFFKEI